MMEPERRPSTPPPLCAAHHIDAVLYRCRDREAGARRSAEDGASSSSAAGKAAFESGESASSINGTAGGYADRSVEQATTSSLYSAHRPLSSPQLQQHPQLAMGVSASTSASRSASASSQTSAASSRAHDDIEGDLGATARVPNVLQSSTPASSRGTTPTAVGAPPTGAPADPAALAAAERAARRRSGVSRHAAGTPVARGGSALTSAPDTPPAGPRYPRTSYDRCKTARAMAAAWMSRLMSEPPAPERIESFRARLAAAAPPPSTSATPLPAETSAALGTNTFLDAVRKTKSVDGGAAGAGVPHGSSGSSNGKDGSSSATGGPLHYEALELLPGAETHIPAILHCLREIALSCASLDTLAKVGTDEATGATGRRAKPRTPRPTPSCAGVVHGADASSSSSVLASDEAVLVTRNRELHSEYEAQWDTVRGHFTAVQGLVLNERELTEVLDTALGQEWRQQSSAAVEELTAHESTDNEEDRHTSTTSLVAVSCVEVTSSRPTLLADERAAPPSATRPSLTEAVSQEVAVSADISAAGTGSPLRRTAKEYVPFSETHAARATAVSSLNSNAEPFRTRYGLSPSSPFVAGGGAAREAPDAAGSGGPSAGAAAAAYSPSQMVASFLERVSPPPRPDGAGTAPAPVFPSAPAGTVAREAIADELSDSAASSAAASPVSGGTVSRPAVQPQPLGGAVRGGGGGGASASSAVVFHLESREDMLRRRSAAPGAFYASTSHYYAGGAGAAGSAGSPSHSPSSVAAPTTAARHTSPAHYTGGSPVISSAATTPASYLAGTTAPLSYRTDNGGSAAGAYGNGGGSYTPVQAPRSMPVSPLLSYSTPVLGPQCPYDYVLVIDFEATCEEMAPHGYLFEIIEFPVVLVDVRLQRTVAEFHRFVRPRYKTVLSEFCKSLTGIRQEDVDEAASLEEVLTQFGRWYHQTVPPSARTVFATDGPMDFKAFMHTHSVLRQGIRFPAMFYQWVDVKQLFASFFHCQQGKIKAMLEVLHCPFEGRLHSGIDDARNIARIVIGLLQWGCTLCEVPLSRIPIEAAPVSSSAGPLNLPVFSPAAAGLSSPPQVAGGAYDSSSSSALPLGSPIHLPPSSAASASQTHRHNSSSTSPAPFAVDQGDGAH